jgi:hypothetical protein
VIGTRRVGGGGRTEEIKDLAMKTRYSFELWDLCGTSYAPFPLCKSWCSSASSNCHKACPTTVTKAQDDLRSASIEQKAGLLEQVSQLGARVMAGNPTIDVAE